MGRSINIHELLQFGFKISPEVKPENPTRQPEPPTRPTRSAPRAARTRPCAARASPPGVRAARRAEDGVEIVDSRALICPLGLEPRARTREPVAGRLRPSRAFPRAPRCPVSPKGSRGSKTGFAVVSRSWSDVDRRGDLSARAQALARVGAREARRAVPCRALARAHNRRLAPAYVQASLLRSPLLKPDPHPAGADDCAPPRLLIPVVIASPPLAFPARELLVCAPADRQIAPPQFAALRPPGLAHVRRPKTRPCAGEKACAAWIG